MRSPLAANTRFSAIIAGLAIGVSALGMPPAHADDSAYANVTKEGECVLQPDGDGGFDTKCGAGLKRGAKAVTVYQHPFYNKNKAGWADSFYLPDGKSSCTTTRNDTDLPINIKHKSSRDNRISSVKTFNKCDIRLYDGHNLKENKRGHTGWIEYCERLSRKSGKCKQWTGSGEKPFDNVTSSFKIS